MLIDEKDLKTYLRMDFLRKVPDLQKLFAKFYRVESNKKHNMK